RLLHLSDLHIGKQVNEFPLLEDQARMLETIVGIIGEKHVDAVIIAGDVYERSAPSADAVACFDRFLSSVADAGAACVIIPGNHDSAERIAY
ncbi:exonuclease subunit SbcD, partial [Acinetobacter baumannii]|uniref:metallophosphoesterase family protein n=1 Tax=Acinetobacter baumannii TaxID=470 RepID=UPI003318E4B6